MRISPELSADLRSARASTRLPQRCQELAFGIWAELEELIESYRTFATTLTLSTSVERATRRKLVARKPSGSLGQRQTPERRENSSWRGRVEGRQS
ncbi:MAG TPA: hypothetical protein VNW73_06615 [Ktedonobacteraceae bacterium]|nr:hypothetical protein [Ktedonobacteraceae bacterium]